MRNNDETWALVKEFESWVNSNLETNDPWEDLKKCFIREKLLVSVLRFYADSSNYEPQDYKGLHYIKPIGDEHSPLSDRGKKAREVLDKMGWIYD